MRPNEPKKQPSKSIYMLKVLSALVILSMVMAAAMSAGSSIGGKTQSGVTLTGIVTDTMCGNTHGTEARGDAECTRVCVTLGAGYALAVGKKVYMLQGHQADLDRFAGEAVIVKGKVRRRDTVVVESVTPVIIEVLRAMPVDEASE